MDLSTLTPNQIGELNQLNPKQLEAVTAADGPVLIVAGPGSGKTKVLVFRAAYLIQNKVPPKNILAITFTNKAAQEMKSRLALLLSSHSQLPFAGTFHAFCSQILRRELNRLPEFRPLTSNFTIYDEDDSRDLIKKILKELNIPDNLKPAGVLENISRAKNDFIDENEYAIQANGYYLLTISKVYNLYQSYIRKANALDFDDLILLTIRIFQKNPEIIEKYQEKFKYIIVDEYQDTNHAQYVLINLLAKKYRNICVIGDEAQSIYSWRGADISNILNFKRDYPEAKTILLEQNYRSTPNIIEAAHSLISNNTSRLEKNLWTKQQEEQQPLFIYQAENEKDEAGFIVSEIDKLKREGFDFSDFAVLYRINAQSRPIEEAFLRCGFPYKIIGGLKFYNRKEIKDLLAFLRLIQNSDDLIASERIVKIPFKKEGAKNKKEAIKRYLDDLRQTEKNFSLANLLELIIERTNYAQYILDSAPTGENKWENIQELFTVIKDYDHLPWPEAIKLFLEQAALLSNSDEIETKKNLVNLMTIHSAKGLEFPIVFITGCEEGIFPYSKSYLSLLKIEEERRLCYVGITRTKKIVYLTFARQRNLFGSTYANQPSRFLNEIPKHLIKKLFL